MNFRTRLKAIWLVLTCKSMYLVTHRKEYGVRMRGPLEVPEDTKSMVIGCFMNGGYFGGNHEQERKA